VLIILVLLIHSWTHACYFLYHPISNYNFLTIQTPSICLLLPLFAFHHNDRCCYRSILSFIHSFIHPVVVFFLSSSSFHFKILSLIVRRHIFRIRLTARVIDVCLRAYTRICRWNMCVSQFSCLRFFFLALPLLSFFLYILLYSRANGSRLWVIVASCLTE
jgi:hypothetical protein